jgi:hypothetical protein
LIWEFAKHIEKEKNKEEALEKGWTKIKNN